MWRRGMSAAGIDLFNRDEELKVLSDFLAHSHELPLALLLQGEAGIGKTTLWRCDLALGVPAVVQDCGFGDAIPTGDVVLSFSTLAEAAGRIENLASAPCRHARARQARSSGSTSDSDRSSPGCSPTPSTASQRTDALRARCTGASGVKRPLANLPAETPRLGMRLLSSNCLTHSE